LHVALSLFTFGFTVLHVVVLATDRYAGVGWWGCVVPMGAAYRPLPVTFGVLGLWLAILIALTAAVAGRLPGRIWWPLHKVAALSLVAIWLHALTSGSDSVALRPLYLVTAVLVLGFGLSRYAARTPADARRELLR
jgi:predicted ferric reductase